MRFVEIRPKNARRELFFNRQLNVEELTLFRWTAGARELDFDAANQCFLVDRFRRVVVEAGLERLRWAVHHGDRDRSRRAIEGLLSSPQGGARLRTIKMLVHSAEDRWGAPAVAEMLVGVETSKWDRTARGRIALERARLLDVAGDTAGAAEQTWRVAGGLGESATEARLQLAFWQLTRARDLVDIYSVRAILLPVGGDSQASRTLAAVDELERFVAIGQDEPLAWFAAAEVARKAHPWKAARRCRKS